MICKQLNASTLVDWNALLNLAVLTRRDFHSSALGVLSD
jgi:hypothetical protein